MSIEFFFFYKEDVVSRVVYIIFALLLNRVIIEYRVLFEEDVVSRVA